MVQKVYKGLTEDQLKRGVIFSSALSTNREETKDSTIHEVLKNQKDADEVMDRLLNDKFFNKSHYKFNVVRTLRKTNLQKYKKYWK